MKTIILITTVLYSLFIPEIRGQTTDSFLKAPQIVLDPASHHQYSEKNRKFTGIPSIAVTKNGKMWATWYAGITSGEDQNNYVVVANSEDSGKTWKEILVVNPDGEGPVRAFDPEIWMDPDNTLWLFWAQAIEHEGTVAGVWAMKTDDPDSKETMWSDPERLTDGIMMCKPTVLSNGEWLLPVSTWRLTDESAKVIVSTDKGKTWGLRGACHVPESDRAYDEHMIVERTDGSLWMLVRTKYGIGESVSTDLGRTWSGLKPSGIQHTSSRFFIRKLDSGNLLLVKHGPVGVKTNRSHLMAFISKDDGKTWSTGLLLDERTAVSYPDGQQTEDGKIHVIYDFSRTREQEILLTTFFEEDIISENHDNKIIEVFNNRKVVSKGGS